MLSHNNPFLFTSFSDTVSNGVSIYYSNYGCDGGFTETAYEYIMKAGGLTTEALYPYSSYYASSGTCNTAATDYAVKVSNFHVLDSETSMESHLLSTGPLSVCLDASLWSSYSSGIVKNCGKSIDHCVQVTGINLDEGYYTVRNSWGTKWGESGFIYLSTVSAQHVLDKMQYDAFVPSITIIRDTHYA